MAGPRAADHILERTENMSRGGGGGLLDCAFYAIHPREDTSSFPG